MKLTVAKRLALLVGVALLGILVLAGIGQYQMQKVFDHANYGNINTAPSLKGLNTAIAEFGRLRVRLDRIVLNTDDKAEASIEDSIKASQVAFDKALKDYEALLSDEKDKAMLAADRAARDDFYVLMNQVLDLTRADKNDAARETLLKSVASAQKVNNLLDEHMQYNVDLGSKAAEEAVAAKTSSLVLALVLTVLTLVVVAFIGYYIARGLRRQLGGEPDVAADVANRIAGGDVSTRIELAPGDETSLMAAMSRLADKLEWYRSIIDAVPFPIHVIDMNMNWTFLNKAFEKLMVERGYPGYFI